MIHVEHSAVLLSALLIVGCAGLPAPYEPRLVFEGASQDPTEINAPERLPEPPRPTALQRVDRCEGEGCYLSQTHRDAFLAAYTNEELDELMTYFELVLKLEDFSEASIRRLVAKIEERNALVTIGKLTEAQIMLAVQQAQWYERQYRIESISSRIVILLSIIAVLL